MWSLKINITYPYGKGCNLKHTCFTLCYQRSSFSPLPRAKKATTLCPLKHRAYVGLRVELIHRQTGNTTFELVKELRNGWRAFWFNNTASLFDLSLKKPFDPYNEKEDYLVEDVLQRSFQSGRLERQKSALNLDFFELTNKWLKPSKPLANEHSN